MENSLQIPEKARLPVARISLKPRQKSDTRALDAGASRERAVGMGVRSAREASRARTSFALGVILPGSSFQGPRTLRDERGTRKMFQFGQFLPLPRGRSAPWAFASETGCDAPCAPATDAPSRRARAALRSDGGGVSRTRRGGALETLRRAALSVTNELFSWCVRASQFSATSTCLVGGPAISRKSPDPRSFVARRALRASFRESGGRRGSRAVRGARTSPLRTRYATRQRHAYGHV